MSNFNFIYAEAQLTHRAKTVYIYLRDRADASGVCWPGIKTIARDMNLSRSTVKRALADLEQHGYLASCPGIVPMGVTPPISIRSNKAKVVGIIM